MFTHRKLVFSSRKHIGHRNTFVFFSFTGRNMILFIPCCCFSFTRKRMTKRILFPQSHILSFPSAEQGSVRLVDGFTSSQGRVEYYDDGQWSTVCDTVGDLRKATVVCRQLGYLAASEAFGGSYFGSGSSDQPIDAISCHGYEAAFEDCDLVFGPESCQYHENDAGVICTDQGMFWG